MKASFSISPLMSIVNAVLFKLITSVCPIHIAPSRDEFAFQFVVGVCFSISNGS